MCLKVLHIWNTAGVGSILAKYQRKILGWNTFLITRKKYDFYGFTTFGKTSMLPSKLFAVKVLSIIPKADIVHIHSLHRLVPIIRRIYPKKPIVLHYHGSEIRGKWKSKEMYWIYADAVLVSTPDLLAGAPRHVIYLPNPVDTELFRPMPEYRISENIGIFIHRGYTDYDEAIRKTAEIAKKIKIKVFIHDSLNKPIPYLLMPKFLNKFNYFIDRWWINSLSKTALEALACGLKVIRWDGKVIQGLPQEHKPEYVVRKLARIYYEVLSKYTTR